MPFPSHSKDTRAVLLNVAEKLFLARGYEHVRVRDITDTARVNVAAVNYHFDSKDNLYRAVLRRRFRDIARRRIEHIDQVLVRSGSAPVLADVIAAYVRSFFDDAAVSADNRRHLALVYREMSPDAVAPDLVASELATPINRSLRQAILLACPKVSESYAAFCASSVTGQVLHLIFMREIFRSLVKPASDQEYIEFIIRHITAFSLHGICSDDREPALSGGKTDQTDPCREND
ncbi:MAG TPA: CerR family C-terminal domain-containing protein [Tichowtungia sp.]|nr:CerR family C-terminal domain-containing protein [Tichowtungia sp.]HKL26456.1 CerR family C-terminal domain-containing protein [Desulfuromonadales bacterium]